MTYATPSAIIPDDPPISSRHRLDMHDIARHVRPVAPDVAGVAVIDIFNKDPSLSALPVVDDGTVVGLLARQKVFLNFSRQFGHAVFARRPAARLMTTTPLIVDAATTLDELRHLVINEVPDALEDGFVITRNGRYMGVGTSMGILRLGMAQTESRARELAEAKRAAEQANAAKSRFLANMSHELRTPLNAIIGFSEMIAAETLGPHSSPRYKEYAEDVMGSGRLLLDIINDILDMSKIEAGHFKLKPEPIEISPIIDGTVHLVSERAGKKNIRLAVEMGHDLPQALADARAARQILLNLLSNAVKFSLPGGRITVRVTGTASALEICVADQGVGISKNDLERVSDPFYQVENEMTRKEQGTGLGLPIVVSLAERMNARFWLESEEGKGTRATLALPLV